MKQKEKEEPPFSYLRVASLVDGEPVLSSGEGAVQWPKPDGNWYVIDDQISLEQL